VPPLISVRIKRRMRLWRRLRLTTHTRARCRYTHRTRELPLESWRCCRFWQRQLTNKHNSREFAALHSVAVPELYWCGHGSEEIPFEDLPNAFVIRPTAGTRAEGVYAMKDGVDLMTGRTKTPEDLRRELRAWVRKRPRRELILVEEFLRTPEGETRFPVEYKFYVFGDAIGLISAVSRDSERRDWACFREDWSRFDQPMFKSKESVDSFGRPDSLENLCEAARKLGRSFGSFVRVDLYETNRGVVFGEFGATPGEGRGFSAHGDRYLGELWHEHWQGTI